MTNPHEGHRSRMRKRFRDGGVDSFAAHELLEMLLFYSVPQMDTNELAHRLVNSFGGLSGVFDAQYEDLLKMDGIGEYSATLLKFIPALSRRYLTDRAGVGVIIKTATDAGEYLLPRFHAFTYEVVMLVCLDAKNKVLGTEIIDEGGVNSARADVRKIVAAALKHNASFAILAHNHTSGLALPSQQDVQSTHTIAAALAAIDVKLLDHIITADDDFVSLEESGML